MKNPLLSLWRSIELDESSAESESLFASLIRSILRTAYPEYRETADSFLGSDIDFLPPSDFAERGGGDFPALERQVRSAGREQARELLSEDDPFGRLYQAFFSKKSRQKRGEFFTPPALARYIADKSPLTPESRVLDPACGSGVFLAAIRERRRKMGISDPEIITRLAGFDLNPLSVLMSRAHLAARIFADPEFNPRLFGEDTLPVYHEDSVRSSDVFESGGVSKRGGNAAQNGFPFGRRADLLIGNPPWIHWDRFDSEERRQTESLWKRYGLFNLSGFQARMGGGKKEWAGLFLYAVCDRLLSEGGNAAMLIPLSLLKSGLSGEGFRRLKLDEEGGDLALWEIDDFSDAPPFTGVSTPVAAIFLRKGKKTVWPVPVVRWEKIKGGPRKNGSEIRGDGVVRFGRKTFRMTSMSAEPSDPLRSESSLRFFNGRDDADLDGVSGTVVPSDEPSPYLARLGVNTAGANGVFWFVPADLSEETPKAAPDDSPPIDPSKRSTRPTLPPSLFKTTFVKNLFKAGKRTLPEMRVSIESELLFRLVRWRDVVPFHASPSGLILLTQNPATRRGIDPQTMSDRYPNALRYLESFRSILESRAAYRKFQTDAPYWSLYNVCQATLAPVKVVWRRMDSQLRAAVLLPDSDGRPILPQETLSMIAVETVAEADYLAAVLNAPETRHRAHSVGLGGTKGFGSPGILPLLKIARFDPNDPNHRSLSESGREKRENAQNKSNC